MGDLISRSRLKEELKSWAWLITKPQYYHREDADFVIDAQTSIDIVHCKDCNFYKQVIGLTTGMPKMRCENSKAIWTFTKPDDFCSYGERKE